MRACLRLHREGIADILSLPLFCPRVLRRFRKPRLPPTTCGCKHPWGWTLTSEGGKGGAWPDFDSEAQDPAFTESRSRSHGRPRASPDMLFSDV